MGLIRNAFEQGRQCVEGLPKNGGDGTEGFLDLVIVGCGPAGLSAALTAQSRGMSTAVLEREDIGGTVRHYPRKKLVMTEPLKIPGIGKVGSREILKEDLIGVWEDAVSKTGLEVETGITVSDVKAHSRRGVQCRIHSRRTSGEAGNPGHREERGPTETGHPRGGSSQRRLFPQGARGVPRRPNPGRGRGRFRS